MRNVLSVEALTQLLFAMNVNSPRKDMGEAVKRLELANKLRDSNQFAMRSCWECNSAHMHLKTYKGLFVCFACGRWFMDGNYLEKDTHSQKELEPCEYQSLKLYGE